ncbi:MULTISPECIES: alpha/beta fold hydrolase [Arthrobacter]|uniref:Alpha/beta fold hydrolase n=2 Tax=Arthrobacter TaxID=1663 RepID=A0ABU9KH58_9MICC|nr:alpha/beta fold hydrolase [Arthrobacter sp. YJM1]MDP5226223.1 alpha/beta fold hydrolase [Arthrobacter sp. YJM1]
MSSEAIISHEPFFSDGHGPRGRVGVVLAHGFTGSPHALRDWAAHLADAGFAVRMPLLPGHGTSWEDLATRHWQDWYRAYEAAYQELAQGCDAVVSAGLSMGGCLALRLAALKPVAGTVVVNPGLVIDDWRAPLAGVLKHVLKSTPAIGNDILKPGGDEGAYDRTPTASAHELYKLFANTRELLPRIGAPVHLFRSRTDHIVGDSSVRALQAGLRDGLLETQWLENSYHVATLDNDAPGIFAGSVSFIDALEAGRGR